MKNLKDIMVRTTDTIREAMLRISIGLHGIVLVVDEENRLVATITDGDVRRAILAGISIDETVARLTTDHRNQKTRQPITMPVGTPKHVLLETLKTNIIRHLPLLDSEGRVADVIAIQDLLPDEDLPAKAVIMAGGFGERLRPLTDTMPKPMLPVDGRPLLERMVERLRRSGVSDIDVTTHYLPDKITDHFGDGSNFGVRMRYVPEEKPLGTAGSLRLLEECDEPLFVLNGDILTGVNFGDMLEFHRKRNSGLTVGVRQFEFEVPYGVIQAADGRVQELREKPKYEFLVNAGVYLLEPEVRKHIPPAGRFDMTDLIDLLLKRNEVIVSFPIVEYWLDIGRRDDFERAQHDAKRVNWAA